MIVKEAIFGISGVGISQGVNTREKIWDAILVYEGPTPPPPPSEFKFPWWLVGVGAVAAVAIRTKQIMKREKRS
jgi:hypothetical protein